MNDDINKKRKRGRPRSSHDFHTVPVHQEKPDLRKLASALLALAVHQLKEEGETATPTEATDESA